IPRARPPRRRPRPSKAEAAQRTSPRRPGPHGAASGVVFSSATKLCEALAVTQPDTSSGIEGSSEEILFDGHPAVLPTLGAWILSVLTLGLAAIYYYARSRSQ